MRKERRMTICLNRLLNTLPKTHLRKLLKDCELVQLFYGEVIFEIDEKIDHVYFPLDSVFSLCNDDGKQIALIDNNGAVGTEICLNEDSSKSTAIVSQAGWAYKVDKLVFLSAFNTTPQCPFELINYAYEVSIKTASYENEKSRIKFSHDNYRKSEKAEVA